MARSEEIDLVPLFGDWDLWSEVWLRSAGFPARLAIELGFDRSKSFDEERRRVSQRLRDIASDTLFREALTWQNRRVLHQTVRSFLKRSVDAQDSKTREYERVVTSYVHRYTWKNDTIGFFGPVARAQLVPEREQTVIEAGPELLGLRNTYLEPWCVDEVARAISRDPELRAMIAPRLHPAVRIEGRILERADGSTAELSEAFARILARIDGRSASRLASELIALDPTWTAEDVYDAIEQLADSGVVIWELEVPVDVPHPEEVLREEIAKLPESPARARALEVVNELSAARARVSNAAGTPELDAAIAALEEWFERYTGASAVRRPGETYAGRTLIFEDCVRDFSAELGALFLQRLKPLHLVLASARWYTFEIARRYRARLALEFDEAMRALGSSEVDYRVFFRRIAPLFSGKETEAPQIVEDVARELQERWASVLALGDESEIVRTYDELAPRIEEAFAAPCPGWSMARLHSPDVLVSARGADAFAAGDFDLVLGEIHTAVSSLFSKVFVFQHPDPASLHARAARDLPGPTLVPVESKLHLNRAGFLPLRPQDLHLETGSGRAPVPRDRTVALSELLVFARDGELFVKTRDGRLELDLIEVLQPYLAISSVAHFRIMPARARLPRVVVDRMVIARRQWQIDPRPSFESEGDLKQRHFVCRALAEQHEWPRFVFVRIASETKPFMVDLENPISVDTFVRRARNVSRVVVSEMMPDFDHLWLEHRGERYTSELRMVAVDRASMVL